MKTDRIRVALALVAFAVAIFVGLSPLTTQPALADVEPVEDAEGAYCNCVDPWGNSGRGRYVCRSMDCIWIVRK